MSSTSIMQSMIGNRMRSFFLIAAFAGYGFPLHAAHAAISSNLPQSAGMSHFISMSVERPSPLRQQTAPQPVPRLPADTVSRLSTGEEVPYVPVEETNWTLSAAQGAAPPSLNQMHSIYDTSPERVEQAFGGRDRSGDLFGEAKRYVTDSNDLLDMARSREQMANFVTKARETGAP